MSFDNWDGLIMKVVDDYRKSKQRELEITKLKKHIKYFDLQEAHNELYKKILCKNKLKFKYIDKLDCCDLVLYKYNIYQILDKYRVHWLLNGRHNFKRIESVKEQLYTFFKKVTNKNYTLIHEIDYLDNYKCKMIFRINNISKYLPDNKHVNNLNNLKKI